MTEHIVAAFETETAAAEAERELEATGIERSAIRRYLAELQPGETETRSRRGEAQGGGFWAWLMGEEPHYETSYDADVYDRRVAAGNAVLSVTVADDSKIHQVVDILDAHHPLDIDERTDDDEGTRTAMAPGSSLAADRVDNTMPGYARGTTGGESVTNPAGAPAGTGARSGRPAEEVIPVAEEELDVGKRMVDRGTTRVRRYVVEQPVERDVTLQGERVTVERRRPAGATEAPGGNAFEERTVEVHETEEVPEVRKTARVVEEVAVRRENTERQEHVRDTVRRDEVEISPDRATSTRPEKTRKP